jgi:hypothetical protein
MTRQQGRTAVDALEDRHEADEQLRKAFGAYITSLGDIPDDGGIESFASVVEMQGDFRTTLKWSGVYV